jgi:spermidine synthase
VFEVYQKLIEPLASMEKDGTPTHALFLGLGAGIGPKLLDGSTTKKTIVEIDPLVLKVARTHFGFATHEDERVIIDDARAFLRKDRERYDLIVVDLYRGASSDPFVWTQEMFREVSNSLAPRGVAAINLPAIMNERGGLLNDVIATLQSVFPFVSATSKFPNRFANVVLYASHDSLAQSLGNALEDNSGRILTDRKNNVEYAYAESAIRLLRLSRLQYNERERVRGN